MWMKPTFGIPVVELADGLRRRRGLLGDWRKKDAESVLGFNRSALLKFYWHHCVCDSPKPGSIGSAHPGIFGVTG